MSFSDVVLISSIIVAFFLGLVVSPYIRDDITGMMIGSPTNDTEVEELSTSEIINKIDNDPLVIRFKEDHDITDFNTIHVSSNSIENNREMYDEMCGPDFPAEDYFKFTYESREGEDLVILTDRDTGEIVCINRETPDLEEPTGFFIEKVNDTFTGSEADTLTEKLHFYNFYDHTHYVHVTPLSELPDSDWDLDIEPSATWYDSIGNPEIRKNLEVGRSDLSLIEREVEDDNIEYIRMDNQSYVRASYVSFHIDVPRSAPLEDPIEAEFNYTFNVEAGFFAEGEYVETMDENVTYEVIVES